MKTGKKEQSILLLNDKYQPFLCVYLYFYYVYFVNSS